MCDFVLLVSVIAKCDIMLLVIIIDMWDIMLCVTVIDMCEIILLITNVTYAVKTKDCCLAFTFKYSLYHF